MTMGEYTALVERTKGRCAVCSKIPARRLDIDHSPRTGLVRGLLCSPCNLAVGHLDRVGVSAFAAYMALNDW